MPEVQQVLALPAKLFPKLGGEPVGSVAHAVHARVLAQAGGAGGLPPQCSGHAHVPWRRAAGGGGRFFFTGQAQAGFAPVELFAFSAVRSVRRRRDDGDEAAVHLGEEHGGGDFWWRHFQGAHLRAVGQGVPVQARKRHVHSLVFTHAQHGARAAFLRAKVHQHALEPPRGAAPAQPSLRLLHGNPPEGGLPFQELFFTGLAGVGMSGAHLRLGAGCGFVGPAHEDFLAELA